MELDKHLIKARDQLRGSTARRERRLKSQAKSDRLATEDLTNLQQVLVKVSAELQEFKDIVRVDLRDDDDIVGLTISKTWTPVPHSDLVVVIAKDPKHVHLCTVRINGRATPGSLQAAALALHESALPRIAQYVARAEAFSRKAHAPVADAAIVVHYKRAAPWVYFSNEGELVQCSRRLGYWVTQDPVRKRGGYAFELLDGETFILPTDDVRVL